MLVLLPPSEGKVDPPEGALPVDLEALVHPELTAKRTALIKLLDRVSKQTQGRALKAFALSKGQVGEIERNRDLFTAPAAAAADVYNGVLYQHLDLASLTPAARERASERLLVSSALWGVVGLEDRIPSYRLNMNAKLPGIRGLSSWWRPALTKALPATELLVDLRSQGYAAAWRPSEGAVVNVRAFVEAGRQRKVITHMAKATRGEVARILAKAPRAARSPDDVAALIEQGGLRVELVAAAGPGDAWSLDVIRDAP